MMTRMMDTTARLNEPRATRGSAPSRSPTDTLYAPGLGVARGLGWFSIGLGLAEIFMPDKIAKLSGVENRELLRAYGLREIISGVGILSSTRPAGWMWSRVAGDALDIATVGAAMAGEDADRAGRARTAALALAGVTALDMICATQLSAAAALEG